MSCCCRFCVCVIYTSRSVCAKCVTSNIIVWFNRQQSLAINTYQCEMVVVLKSTFTQQSACTPAHMHAHMHMQARAHTRAHIHAHTHTRTHARTHAHAYTSSLCKTSGENEGEIRDLYNIQIYLLATLREVWIDNYRPLYRIQYMHT